MHYGIFMPPQQTTDVNRGSGCWSETRSVKQVEGIRHQSDLSLLCFVFLAKKPFRRLVASGCAEGTRGRRQCRFTKPVGKLDSSTGVIWKPACRSSPAKSSP